MSRALVVDHAMGARIERAIIAERTAFVEGVAQSRPDAGAGWLDVAGGRAIFTAVDLFTNRAVGLGIDGPVRSSDIAAVDAFYAARSCRAEVEICPFSHASVLGALAQAGYRLQRFRNIYATVPTDAPPAGRDHIEVLEVGAPERAEWSAALLDGFGYHTAADRARVDAWNTMVWSRPTVAAFLATTEGLVAGGASVMVVGNVAVLGGAATRPALRCRGVQQALILARLAWAARAGCNLAVVTADPDGTSARNAERCGFRLVCNHVGLCKVPLSLG